MMFYKNIFAILEISWGVSWKVQDTNIIYIQIPFNEMQLKVAITGTFFGTKFLAPFAAGVETRNPSNKHKNFPEL